MTSCRFHPDARQLPPITIIDANGKRHEGVVFCVACEMEPKCSEAPALTGGSRPIPTFATEQNAPSEQSS